MAPVTGIRGSCVDDRSSITGNGNAIQLAPCNQTSAQLWRVRSDRRLEVLGKCMTVSGDSTSDGTPIVLIDCGTAGLSYRAENLPAGLSIDSTTGTVSGTPTTTAANNVTVTVTDGAGNTGRASFLWRVADGPITGVAGRCVDDRSSGTANGNAIQLAGCNQTAAQLWTIRSDGRLAVLGKCLTVSDDGTADGTAIVLYDCGTAGSQVWQPQGNGTLLNPASGRCLNAPNPESGTQLTLAACTANGNQQWKLPTAPTVTVSK